MSPSDLEEYLKREPLRPVRLTLSSGDQVVIKPGDKWVVEGLALALTAETTLTRVTTGVKLVSVPNVVLVEPLDNRPPDRSRRGRR